MKKIVKIGNKFIGGNYPILIQSMTNTKTKDTFLTINQIKKLENVGCELVRVAVLDMEDAKALNIIKENINIPLIADIHFDYKLALEAINQGVDKIRINPGNLKNEDELLKIINAAKLNNTAIRIGLNSGSIDSYKEMLKKAKKWVNFFEKNNFYNIVLSFKSSNIDELIKVNTLANKIFKYPLHIGLTESGSLINGTVKSVLALNTLLNKKIGQTIRISLTGDPVNEIKVAKELLRCKKLKDLPEIISCPTCGRLQYNMQEILTSIEEYVDTLNKPIKIAVMGCVVNGPGEAKRADIGIAGGKDCVVLFEKGKIIKKIDNNKELIINELKKEIEKL